MLHITFSKYDCTIIYQVWVYFHCISITLKLLQNHNYNYMTSCIGVLMLHITFSKYDCIIVHKAYYVLTCTCVSINSFHSHSHSHIAFNCHNLTRLLQFVLQIVHAFAKQLNKTFKCAFPCYK